MDLNEIINDLNKKLHETSDSQQKIDLLYELSEHYHKMGLYKKALEYFKLYSILKETLNSKKIIFQDKLSYNIQKIPIFSNKNSFDCRFLNTLFESLDKYILVINSTGIIQYANSLFLLSIQVESEKVFNKNFKDLLATYHRFDHTLNKLRDASLCESEKLLLKKGESSFFWVSFKTISISSTENGESYYLLIGEEPSKEHKSDWFDISFQKMEDAFNTGVLITDHSGVIVFANPQSGKLLKLNIAEIKSNLINSIFWDINEDSCYQMIEKSVLSGKVFLLKKEAILNHENFKNIFYFEDVTIFYREDIPVEIIAKKSCMNRLGVTLSSISGKIIHANATEANAHYFEPEELINSDIGVFSKMRNPMSIDQIKNLSGIIRESNNIKKDGSVFPIRLLSEVICDEDENPISVITCSENITDKKKIQEELTKLSAIFSTSDEAIYAESLDGTIISWNEGAEDIFGYSALEIKGKSVNMLVPKKKLPEIDRLHDEVLHQKIIESFETTRIDKNGNRLFVSLTISPIRNSLDAIIGYSTIVRNITKQKKTENALIESEKKFRTLTENLSVGIFRFESKKYSFIEANPAMCNLFEYDNRDDFIKLKFLDLFADEATYFNLLEELKKKNIIHHKEIICKKKDGDTFFAAISVVTTRQPDGQFLYDCVLEDITERKDYHQKINHLNLMLRNLREIDFLIQRETNQDELLQKITEVLVQQHGYRDVWIFLIIDNQIKQKFSAGSSTHFLNCKDSLPDCMKKAINQKKSLFLNAQSEECLHCTRNSKQNTMIMNRLSHGNQVFGVICVNLLKNLTLNQEEINVFEDIAQDISHALQSFDLDLKRKKMETKLKQSEIRFRKLFENSNDAIFIHDRKGKIVDMNGKAADMIGLSLPDMKTIPLDLLFESKSRKILQQALDELEIKPSIQFELQLEKANGLLIDVHVSEKVIDQEQGLVQCIVRDITDQKWAEEALESNLTLLQTLLETIPNPIFYKDTNGVYLGCNSAYCNYIGFSKEEIIGRTADMLVEKKQADIFRKAEEETLKQGQRITEAKIKYADGKFHQVITTLNSFHWQKQKIGGVVGVMLDITERKRIEEALKESEERLKTVLHSLPTGVIIIDPENHTIIDANPNAVDMIGTSKDKIVGSICHEFICPNKQGECPITDKEHAVDNSEQVLIGRNKEAIPILKTVVPINLNGKKFLLESFVNISMLKKTQKALEESEKKYKLLTEDLKDIVMKISPDGTLEYISPAIYEFAGYNAEQVLSKPVAEYFVNPKELAKAMIKLKNAEKNGEDFSLEFLFKPKVAEPFYVEISGRPVMQDNKVVTIQCVMRDIRERKQAEAQRALLFKEIEHVNAELKEFAYVVSHDLKAPLRGIHTLASWIIMDYADAFDEDGKEQMNLLMNRVNRMHDLIEGILQYSRVGRIREEKISIDLQNLVPEIIDFLSPPENISIKIDTELPIVVFEKTRIKQVFQNLLSNAIKYNDKEKGLINVGCTKKENLYEFYVKDNGPGIDEKHFETIFKIFQTLHSKDEFESTGVGLTLIKRIIEMYGGSIWLKSEVGISTSFYFTIPIELQELL